MRVSTIFMFCVIAFSMGVVVCLFFPRGSAPRKQSEKKTISTMDIILIFIAACLIVFTIKMISLFEATAMIPDTLVSCVFLCLGGECGAMAWIKTSKEKAKERQRELEDRKYLEAREDALRRRDREEQNKGGK